MPRTIRSTLARWYGSALATGQTVDMVRTWPDRIRAVTAEAVQQAARIWLDRRHSVTGYLVQKPAARGEPFVNAFAPTWSCSLLRRASLTPVAMAAALTLAVAAVPARATTIQRVVSPGGIEAWLVQEPAVPLIAVDFAFAGGSVQDPAGKSGTANLVASLLDEGAGDLDSQGLRTMRLERKAIEMSFYAERDHLGGSLRTLDGEP